MKVIVWSAEIKFNELNTSSLLQLQRVKSHGGFIGRSADLYINLNDDAALHDYSALTQPLIVNSVTQCLKEIKSGTDIVRINGWNSFLSNPKWEVAGQVSKPMADFFSSIKKEIIPVADITGLISPRIIAMIINEAFLTLEDEVSNREEIDIAMKLGTNYPYGPFEWASLIGEKEILKLLKKLSVTDTRYLPAASLNN